MKGLLTLIPTPLQEELPLEPVALALLHEAAAEATSLILVEELKVARQRWLRWGLPRESIERFVAFNEHTAKELQAELLKKLRQGTRAFLMSDGGLPAFCDPGQALVDACHEAKLQVSCTPFPHSVALTVALSGFVAPTFRFMGFLPQKDPQRSEALSGVAKDPAAQILMDTPYRRQRLLEELQKVIPASRRVFLALELNGPQEKLLRGRLSELLEVTKSLEKQEFVLMLEGLPGNL